MTTIDFTDAVAQFITIDNARTYAAQTDKWLWVVNNILDEMELPAISSFIDYIEDQLDALVDA